MNIRLATLSDRTAWDDFVLNHPEGTAYQLFAWQEAVGKAYGLQGAYLLAEKDATVCGVLPLIDFRVPFAGRSLISLPYCDAGGVLSVDESVAKALIEEARTLARERGVACQIRTIRPLPNAGTNQTDKVRMLLNLPDNAGQLLTRLDTKVRSQVKKPVRDGLTAKLGSVELVDEFYAVFSENMRDLGSPVHSRQWIRAIVAAYGSRARVAVVLTPEGRPAAAGIVLIHPRTMVIPWASSLRRFNYLNPNMLLYWIFLTLAIDQGCHQFDFGRSSPGEGTYRFKAQWGSRPEPLYWEVYSAVGHVPKKGSNGSELRAYAENLWRRLPLPLCNTLGPLVRRRVNL
jgi:FemAB-related protein (PEP-CTERM system-associated)